MGRDQLMRLLATILTILLPASLNADACANNLVPTFVTTQAEELCRHFPWEGTVAGFYLDECPTSTTLTGNTCLGPDVGRNVARSANDLSLGSPPENIAANTSGTENTGVGTEALKDLRYGSDNTCVGSRACGDNTDAYYNTALGHYALGYTRTGWKNTAVGAFTMRGTEGVSNPNNNTAVGYGAMQVATSAQYNTAIGNATLTSLTTGIRNTAVGDSALATTSTGGDGNTGVGQSALYEVTTGDQNVAVGYETGRGITTGSNNTIVGSNVSGLATGLSSNIILANGTGAIKAQHDGTDWTLTGAVTGTSSITSSSTGALGWSVVDGTDDTPCTSQCTSAAVIGFQVSAGEISGLPLAPSVNADICICAGGS